MSSFRAVVIVLTALAVTGCDTESGSTPESGSSSSSVNPVNATAKEGLEQLQPARADLPDVAKLLDPDTTVGQLEKLIASFDLEQLKSLGTQLMEKVKGQEEILKSAQEKLDKLGNVDALQKQLEDAKGLLETYMEKLQAVVGTLKEKGGDVSSFTEFLNK